MPSVIINTGRSSRDHGWKHEILSDNESEERIMALGDGQEAVVIPVQEAAAPVPLAISNSDEVQVETQNEAAAAPANGSGKPAPVVTPAVEQALRKRYDFWKTKLAQASDEAMVEAAADAIGRIEKEAVIAGVDLKQPMAGQSAVADGGVAGGTVAQTGAAKKKKGKSKTPRSVAEKEAASNHTAQKLAEQAASKPAGEAKAQAASQPKKNKVLRPCLDGCGAMVGGNFQMGHDAKLKSLLLKIERGEEDISKVPAISEGIIKLKKGAVENIQDAKGTILGTRQTWVLLAAPVKFHNRPEVQLTQREAESQ